MKHKLTLLIGLGSLACITAAVAQMPEPPKPEAKVNVSSDSVRPAIVRIDLQRVIDQIDPRIYGLFMEPIGFHDGDRNSNTLYGPVYDPKSPSPTNTDFAKTSSMLPAS